MNDTDQRTDTERRRDSLCDDLLEAELNHDGPRARHLWAELQPLLPAPRPPAD